MSIASELRLKRRGQLDKLKQERHQFDGKATDALVLLLLKADPVSNVSTLDTEAILRAAESLDESVRAIKGLDLQIMAINEELYG